MSSPRVINADNLSEGELFFKWMRSRILTHNKNVLGVELGPTGSGKSYRDLRKAEIWYRGYLKRPFPKENICFGIGDIMRRLRDIADKAEAGDKSHRGEVFIFEEAGANLGSLDFNNKLQKMFTYVLQSFRSMNVAIFFNLPYLSMLNKSARMLLHYSSESLGVDFQRKINNCKLFFHQVNQGSGKIYKKFPRASVNGHVRTFKSVAYQMPSKEIIDAYEEKKAAYLKKLTQEYVNELNEQDMKNNPNLRVYTKPLSDRQQQIYDLYASGITDWAEIGKKLGIGRNFVYENVLKMRLKGVFIGKKAPPT